MTAAELVGKSLNPWGLGPGQLLAAFLAVRAGIYVWDNVVEKIVELSGARKLPTRDKPVKPELQPELNRLSYIYLTINAIDELIFVMNITYFMWHSPLVKLRLDELSVLNTFPALYVMFLSMDAVYAPLHRFMHWRPVYPLVHKHHHRQIYPTRGYADAANEHPIEHVIGVACSWAGIFAAAYTTGVHAATLAVFFNIHAALAMLNHSPYDVEFNYLGFNYSVKAHEMHHRKFTLNYAQYFMLWDRAMGTFRPYAA
jgi:sterol desaturase/sphingolipid hydroxylase (fatty acid hydroxylase superfamily)